MKQYTAHSAPTQEPCFNPTQHPLAVAVLTSADGTRAQKIHSPSGSKSSMPTTWNVHWERLPENLPGLAAWLAQQAQNPHSCVMFSSHDCEELHNVRRQLATGFQPAARQYLWVDVDSVVLPEAVDFTDGEELTRAALSIRDTHLPPEFWGVECVVQFTAGAFWHRGPAPTKPKLRIIALLESPATQAQCLAYAKRTGLDPAIYRTVQPTYTAAPRWAGGLEEPLAWRIAVLPGERNRLRLPELPKPPTPTPTTPPKQTTPTKPPPGWQIGGFNTASEWLAAACSQLGRAGEGERWASLRRVACAAGGLVASGEIDEATAAASIESAAREMYRAEPGRIEGALSVIRSGLAFGRRQPWATARQADQWKQNSVNPEGTETFSTLEEVRAALPGLLAAAIERKGATVLRAPMGAGKTTAAIELIATRQWEGQRILFSVPTNERAAEVTRQLRARGVPAHRQEARNSDNCARHRTFLACNAIKAGGGAAYCRAFCGWHVLRGGPCSPPPPPPQDVDVIVCTHANAANVASTWEPDVHIQDESAGLKTHRLSLAELAAAVGAGELQGTETQTNRLLGLVGRSVAGEYIEPRTVEAALAELTAQPDAESRAAALKRAEKHGQPDTLLAADALQAIAESAAGAYLHEGTLTLQSPPRLPEAETRIYLDATATPTVAQHYYGDHAWVSVGLAAPKHTQHLHILCDGASRARNADGWSAERTARVVGLLGERLPEKRYWVGFKQWADGWSAEGEFIWCKSAQARGSNAFQEHDAAVVFDFRIPRAAVVAQARALAGGEPSSELLREVRYQLEIAEMEQAAGRLRPYAATEANPKLLVTMGSAPRVCLGESAAVLPASLAETLLGGEVTSTGAVAIWRALAEQGGLWADERHLAVSAADVWKLTTGCCETPSLLRGSCNTLSVDGGALQKANWSKGLAGSLLTVHYSTGAAGGVLTFLPGRCQSVDDALAKIEARALADQWVRWRVHSNDTELTNRNLVFERHRAPTPRDLVLDVAILESCAERTVERWLADFGGWSAYERHHATNPTPEVGEPRSFSPDCRIIEVTRHGTPPTSGLSGLITATKRARATAEQWGRELQSATKRARATAEQWAESLPRAVPLEEPLPPDERTLEAINVLLAEHHDIVPFYHGGELLSVPKASYLREVANLATEEEAQANLEYLRTHAVYASPWWNDIQKVRFHLNREARAQGYPRSTFTRAIRPNLRSWVDWIKRASAADVRECYLALRLSLEVTDEEF